MNQGKVGRKLPAKQAKTPPRSGEYSTVGQSSATRISVAGPDGQPVVFIVDSDGLYPENSPLSQQAEAREQERANAATRRVLDLFMQGDENEQRETWEAIEAGLEESRRRERQPNP